MSCERLHEFWGLRPATFEESVGRRRLRELSRSWAATRLDLHAEPVVATLKGRQARLRGEAALHSAGGARGHRPLHRGSGRALPHPHGGPQPPLRAVTADWARPSSAADPLGISDRFASGPISKSAWPQDEEVGGGPHRGRGVPRRRHLHGHHWQPAGEVLRGVGGRASDLERRSGGFARSPHSAVAA